MRKIENGIYCQAIADIFTKLIEMFLEYASISQYNFCSLLISIGFHGSQNAEKNIFSETICSMELRLCRNFHHISLYEFCVCVWGGGGCCCCFFYENYLFGLVVAATKVFH